MHNKDDPRIYRFPETKNWKKLQISEEGLYSITPPAFSKFISEKIAEKMKKKFGMDKKEITITDASSCVGGDAIRFCFEFKHVNCVEFNPEHMRMLQNNLKVFGLKNASFYEGSYETFCDKLENDVIFCDPPWGGTDYLQNDSLRLKYGESHVEDLANKAKTKLIVMKLPLNYDLFYLHDKMPCTEVIIVKRKNGQPFFLLTFKEANIIISNSLR